MTITRIKKLIADEKARIPNLAEIAISLGACSENERLGYARGYVDALEEVLKTIKPKKKTPQWILAVDKLKGK
jgi:hypothetical protein